MEKTVTIKIGGTVFHIEDEAYELLKSYLIRIENFYSSDSMDSEEIVSDIEDRVAELLNEKLTKDQIANLRDIQTIIETIGEPEEFEEEESNTEPSTSGKKFRQKQSTGYRNRHFYRDPFNKKIGGVCSGIATFTNTDPSTIRLITTLMVLLGGMSIWVYVLIWIVSPIANNKEQVKQMKSSSSSTSTFIDRLRDQFNRLRVLITNCENAAPKQKSQYREDIVKVAARFTLTISTALLFITILAHSISIPFNSGHFNYDVFAWNNFIHFNHPLSLVLQGLIWFLSLVTIACLVVNFIYSEHKQKLSRDPENSIVGGVCGGIGRSLHIDPVVVRLLYICYIVQFPLFFFAYIVLWAIFPANKYIITDNEKPNFSSNGKEEIFEEEIKDNTTWTKSKKQDYTVVTPSNATSKILKTFLIAFTVFVAICFLFPLISILLAAIGAFTLFPTILDFGGIATFLPHNIEISQLISNSNLVWAQVGVILTILLPILFIALLLTSIFRNKRIPYVGLILILMAISWFVSIGGVAKVAINEIKNYKDVASTTQEDQLSFDSDTLTLAMLDNKISQKVSHKKGWIKWASGSSTFEIDENKATPSIAISIEKTNAQKTSLFLTRTGRGKTVSDAQKAANGVVFNYKKTSNRIEFPTQYELIPEVPFRAQTILLTLRIPEGKTVFLDKSVKKYLDRVENLQDMWDEEMVNKYWIMTNEGLSISEKIKEEKNTL